jgi:hypothetical protein
MLETIKQFVDTFPANLNDVQVIWFIWHGEEHISLCISKSKPSLGQ